MGWTIEIAGGPQTSFADVGLSESAIVRTRVNMAVDTLTLRKPGPMDDALLMTYGQAIVIRKDGVIFFRGKAGLPVRSGSGSAVGINYQVFGPWWDFTRLVYQQAWTEFTGWTIPGDPNSPPLTVTKRTSELFLGQAQNGTRLTTGQQIADAVDWAATCGVPVVAGTIDAAASIPIYNVRDVTVSEVIVQLMRWTPDVMCWFDYSTTPPTFHAQKRSSLTLVNVNLPGYASDIELTPRYDLQLPAVCIKFKQTNTVDGRVSTVFVNQHAPAEATGQELGASVHTIDLAGGSTNNVYGELVCEPVQARNASEAVRIEWWRTRDPKITDETIDPASVRVGVAVIKDNDGNVLSLEDWPNELVDGSVASWMTVGGVPVAKREATAKALLEYDQYRLPVRRLGGVLQIEKTPGVWTSENLANFRRKTKRQEVISYNLRLTNGVTGTYSVLGSFTPGEDVPAGLAQTIYDAHQVLQYEGRVSLLANEVAGDIGIGNRVTLNTGSVVYADQLVQSVTEDLGAGKTTLTIGPANHLGLGDLIELLRVNRHRTTWNNPAARVDGSANGGGNVSLPKSSPKENTTSGPANSEMYGISAPLDGGKTGVSKMDAVNKVFRLEVQNQDGTRDDAAGALDLDLADAGGKVVKIVELTVCDPSTGTQKKRRFAASEAYD